MNRWIRISALAAVVAGALLGGVPAAGQAVRAAAIKPAVGAPLPAGVQRVTTVEGVTEYRLSNGLRVLLYPDAAKPTVTVNVTYLVGSRQENYGETGMAHLLEHLMFKGSARYPSPTKEFSRRGFRINGTTWLDRTNYFVTFKASDENLRWALGWMADAMVHSFIARKDLDSEMSVVRNEYESGENQPSRVMFKRLQSVMYDWHNYSHSPIGNRSDIENVRIENLQAFYRRYYQPDNAVLVVAGQIDAAQVLAWIARDFGSIPAPKRKLPTFWTVEPTQDGERTFTVRRAGDVQMVLAGYRIPSALSRDGTALEVAAEILGDTPNGRLHHELVEKGLASQVFASPVEARDPGFLVFGAIVKKGDSLEAARARLLEVVETGLATTAPTSAEIERVRRDSETSNERVLGNPESFGVGLSEAIALGDWRLFFQSRDAVNQVDAAAAAGAAARYLRRDNRTVGVFVPDDAPQRAEIPAPLTAADLLQDFKPRATVAAGETFDPTQQNIDQRTRRIRVGDLQFALLPKKTRGETVDVAMNFEFGDVRSLTGKAIQQQLAAAMQARGTTRLSRQEFADEMSRLKMQGGLQSFQTVRSTLPDALRLVAQALREPAFAPAEFEQLRRELVTGLQAQLNDPAERGRDALAQHFNAYPVDDPRWSMPLEERIARIQRADVADVRGFHADFWGTARGAIAIVGDFDAAAIELVLREQFGAWASRAPYERILSEPRAVPAKRGFVATAEKENAVLWARINLDLRDDDPDAPALMLANAVFGGGSGLANRFVDRVRQREGLSYGAGSGLRVGGRDRAASWQAYAIAAAPNITKVETALREELARLFSDGVTARELEDARAGLLQQRLLARSDNGNVAGAWLNYLDLDRTFAFSQQTEDRIRALTVAAVNAAVQRHLDPARMTVFVAGDPAKGAR